MTNGTPSDGQFATLVARVVSALPRVTQTPGFDMKQVLRHTEGEGEMLSRAIAEALRMLCDGHASIMPAPTKVWMTLKTIKLGTGLKTADDFRQEIKKAGIDICDLADDILHKPAFVVATCETEVELVTASVAELGFKDGATGKDVYSRAEELGLGLCPPEIGPQLSLQYADQPNGKRFIIAMEPITDSDGDLLLFNIGRDSAGTRRWFHAFGGRPNIFWYGRDRFVFLRRK